MNTTIKNLNIEDLLFFDIETVRASEELQVDTKEYDLYEWKTRNKETDEFLEQKDLIEHYSKRAALFPTFSKIVCISLGMVRGNKMIIMSITGKEADVILEFLAIFAKSKPKLCGFNIIGFDIPTMRKRAYAAGLNDFPLGKANDSGNKPWTLAENLVDLMDVFKGTSYYNESLDEVCYMLNVPSPKDNINGSQVSDTFYAGGIDKIVEYCQKDVISTIQILRRMQGQPLLTEVVYRDNVVIEDKPLLQQVFEEGELSEPQKEKFVAAVEKEGLDKGQASDILTSAIGNKKTIVKL